MGKFKRTFVATWFFGFTKKLLGGLFASASSSEVAKVRMTFPIGWIEERSYTVVEDLSSLDEVDSTYVGITYVVNFILTVDAVGDSKMFPHAEINKSTIG
jgi:hypothetical protein